MARGMGSADGNGISLQGASHGLHFRKTVPHDSVAAVESLDWLADMRYLQSSPGTYGGSLDRLDLADVSLVVESQECSVIKQGVLRKDMCTLSFARASDGGRTRFNSCDVGSVGLGFLPSGVEFDVHVPGGQVVIFAMDERRLCECAAAEGHWLGRHGRQPLILDNIDCNPLAQMVNLLIEYSSHVRLSRELPDASYLSDQLMDGMLALFCRPEWHALPGPSARAHARARAAHDYIEHHFDKPVSVLDMCRALNVSRRTLQDSFMATHGMGPQKYLRIARLNHVRRALQRPVNREVTVTSAAVQMGFLHLARFASDYRKLFGELPSHTLRRSLPGTQNG